MTVKIHHSFITVSATDDHFSVTSLIFIQLLNNWLLLILLVHRKWKRSKYGFVRTSPIRFLGFPFISWTIRSEILIKVSHRWLHSRFTNYLHLKGFALFFCQISERIHSIINSASPILKNKQTNKRLTVILNVQICREFQPWTVVNLDNKFHVIPCSETAEGTIMNSS